MNVGPSGSRSRRRAGVLAAALAGIALLAAACGGGSSPAVAAQTAYQKAVAYAQCMRSHGGPGWPDPDSEGNFMITKKNRVAMGSPQFASANKACEHLDPTTPLTAAQQRQDTTQALKFVACMRSHGIPGFPDPVVNANGVQFHPPADGPGPSSPLFQSAMRACQRLLPGGPP